MMQAEEMPKKERSDTVSTSFLTAMTQKELEYIL
jgi:hypothetical protein